MLKKSKINFTFLAFRIVLINTLKELLEKFYKF